MREVAEAFSRHDFDMTFPHLAEDVRWHVVGDREIEGRAAVVTTCNESTEYLQALETTFTRFRMVVGEHSVVVDSLAEYVDRDRDMTRVASCDLYDFANGALSEITSYTIELRT